MRSGTATWAIANCGATRLCLLVTFVIVSTTTYLYLDKHTFYAFLLQVQRDPYGSLHVFLVAYTISVVVLFPCMILQVVSGALYGFWGGLLVSWVATSAGQSLAFLLGRYLFRPTVKSYLHSTWPTFPTIDAAIKREGWKLVCLLRLSPVLPYNILNYALALTPVSFGVFTVASAVATIPWTALYVYMGTFSTDLMHLSQGKVNWGSGDLHIVRQVLTIGFIVITSVYGYIVSHRAVLSLLKEPQAGLAASDASSSLSLMTGGGGSAGMSSTGIAMAPLGGAAGNISMGAAPLATALSEETPFNRSPYTNGSSLPSRVSNVSTAGFSKRDVELGKQ